MTKRIIHYAVLATALVGVPLVCCILGGRTELLEGIKSFPPRTEDWGFHTEKLWNYRRPFRWGAFIGLMAFTAWCLWPFVKRAWRVAVKAARSDTDIGDAADTGAGSASTGNGALGERTCHRWRPGRALASRPAGMKDHSSPIAI